MRNRIALLFENFIAWNNIKDWNWCDNDEEWEMRGMDWHSNNLLYFTYRIIAIYYLKITRVLQINLIKSTT